MLVRYEKFTVLESDSSLTRTGFSVISVELFLICIYIGELIGSNRSLGWILAGGLDVKGSASEVRV